MKWLPVDSEEGLLTWEHGACQSCRIPDQEGMFSMGSSPPLDQLDICFDDTHAIANAGLLLAAALAERLGIQQAADALIDLGEGAGAAHPGPQAANPGSTRCWQVGMASTTPTCCAVAPARCWAIGSWRPPPGDLLARRHLRHIRQLASSPSSSLPGGGRLGRAPVMGR
jgi:hypothetical protein